MDKAYSVSQKHTSVSEEISEKEIVMGNIEEEQTKVVGINIDYKGKTINVSLEYPVTENESVKSALASRLKDLYIKKHGLGSMQNKELALPCTQTNADNTVENGGKANE